MKIPATALPMPPPLEFEARLSPGQWGVIAFLLSEVSLFSTLIVTYLMFLGRDALPGGLGGPTPLGVLSLNLVLFSTACLLLSSVTIHVAEQQLRNHRDSAFIVLWALTILLGATFLFGTAYEWRDLVQSHGLTISRNLFGTTFYTLVGFHAFHVSAGVFVMLIVIGMAWTGRLTNRHRAGVQLISWYWHFVDAVWIVVLFVVYLLPRVR